MNEMNELERRLGSWAPRRPSARLERELFTRPEEPPARLPRLHWGAPVTAALLLAGMLATQRYNSSLTVSGESSQMIAIILSNQSAPAYLARGYTPEQNRLPSETLEWTYTNGAASRVNSLPVRDRITTND
jgi:hypothetical protein